MLIAAAATAVAPAAKSTARATIRVLRAESVTERDWREASRRSERIVTDEHGRKLLYRLIEFE